ncbi:hypothetical protein [Streptomyces hoynatensis]|uniref:Uncharacterized protein n=1 Tax=Streptomyces hoynatensis TaxID=1141874 RepID=A0A3A9YFF3_9ACTN|nr:hypothetical protein [Streptomyces hoynatensis]RKN35925.1 hypothetical protein D7294_30305 [Streptomyces hoynatensis]
MSTEIASNNPGRAINTYDLLEEIIEATGMDRREAHESIHVLLDQLVDIDGHEAVILSTRPMRPELLVRNEGDVDIYWWIEISDDAADAIRMQLIGSERASS